MEKDQFTSVRREKYVKYIQIKNIYLFFVYWSYRYQTIGITDSCISTGFSTIVAIDFYQGYHRELQREDRSYVL